MALSPTALRIQATLPDYYVGNPILERIIQARANEIDRLDARIDQLKDGVVPGMATDALGLLAVWETTLGLPVSPPAATTTQRQDQVKAQIRRLNAVTAEDVLAILTVQLGTGFTILRDTPGVLQDTITIPLAEGSFAAGRFATTAGRLWPAHRELVIHFEGGFIIDSSLIDEDSL